MNTDTKLKTERFTEQKVAENAERRKINHIEHKRKDLELTEKEYRLKLQRKQRNAQR